MRKLLIIGGLLAVSLPVAPASADIVSSTPTSFELSQTVTITKPRAAVWEMLRSPQKWWAKEHTYSGDSANLYLDTQATGCFCEKLPDRGSVEHARLLTIQPPSMMRLQGALGPLQAEAVTGILTFRLEAEGEGATRVTMTYVVSGYVRAGADAMAPKVDEVLATQLVNLKMAAESAAEPAPEAGK